ncbi:signal peptide-containing protein [Acetobacter malorum]|uniref:Signal peptide-containing protein n=1 Tax=Acetobacter malorum TaxID=178901 RepID=A0A149RMJ4_9PROT|nr:alpha/beta hydrolase [Acetobacter malorum]KXV15218.1 signal peptide-containing protein [Acetobacter malorum]
MHLNRLLLAATCLLAGLSLSPLLSSSHAAPPQKAGKPGTMTAKAALPTALSLPDAGRSLRITYLSTNGITGKGLVPVTEEVILPAGKAPPGGWPIVAWAHGTSGVADHCAPSCNPWSERNRKYMSAWMKRGFAVVGTDYQGLGTPGIHAYLNTRVEAYSVLDGVRAALSSVPGLQNKIMIVGQSQGGGAAFASASYAPDYAPDLNIRGTVATGAPYVSQELLEQMATSGAHEIGFNPVIVYALYLAQGLSGYDSSFKPETVFTEKAMPAYQAAANLCVYPLTNKARAEELNFSNALKPGYQHALAPAFAAMAYPTMKLKQPLFVGTGEVDQDVPPPLQLGLVKAACEAGTVVQAHIYKGLNHDQTVNASLPDSEIFTKSVMSDQPVTPQCTPTPE